ncbi:halocyanin domain-containing protein [Halobaculum sp. WSA2]|uniref:Halocyanin domain-containing protein n=1 Tax=Halobaculum saliterrae TaxID=2073113 RepID=A0A6B0SXK7_9EURY|nr:halocyanin domain-containing protein [Halobaculum saliterrae]MXR40690.1 halocyanin domain-containing protein [Halobaculum saliterrae]
MSDRSLDRRTVLRATGLAAVGGLTGLAGCSGGGSSDGGSGDDAETEEPTPTPTEGGGDSGGSGSASFDGWFDDVDNYDGVVDETGSDSVTVEVGVEANGGAYGFGPAAVRVSSGTTVTWEWTGQGSSHNVAADDGSFESELVAEEGHTFEQTFESTGTTKYVCTPHESLGMKGVVVVE